MRYSVIITYFHVHNSIHRIKQHYYNFSLHGLCELRYDLDI